MRDSLDKKVSKLSLLVDLTKIIFYTDEEGNTKIEVLLQNENVWLNANAIASLFDVDRSVITKHINNIYNEELEENCTSSK